MTRSARRRVRLVLGAGLQGSACAYDLLQNPEVTEVRLFWFAGGWIRYVLPAPTVASAHPSAGCSHVAASAIVRSVS